MTNLLFVYGSLMPALTSAFGKEQRTRLAGESVIAGPATLAATLYNLGQYPGVVLSNSAHKVHGTLLRLADPARTFEWLDPFEDIVPGRDPASAEYQRIMHDVEVRSVACSGDVASASLVKASVVKASVVKAWVYELRRVPPAALIVASGIWHAPSP